MDKTRLPRVAALWSLRSAHLAAIDGVSWVLSVAIAGVLRFEFAVERIQITGFLLLGILLAVFHFLVGSFIGLYGSRYRRGSYDELTALLLASLLVSGPTFIATLVWAPQWGIPRSVLLIAAPIFLLASFSTRMIERFPIRTPTRAPGEKRTLIYGAGTMAELLVPQLLADQARKYFPVGLLDDSPDKADRQIMGVKNFGHLGNLPAVARRLRAQALIVAIPRVTSDILQNVDRVADKLGLEVCVLPSFSEILEQRRESMSVTGLGIEDLIGRRAVKIESTAVASYIQGKTVLVTGAGGSIGVELCRQVARFRPRELIFLDRDETGLQNAELATSNSGLLTDPRSVLADIRDQNLITDIFRAFKPDVVFHAAALKHLPVLERFPEEAWKTNVVGTANVLRASALAGVSRFVNISTDKAADASSVLGRSKKIAEELTAWYSIREPGFFHSVRFGNVLGSRGSLVPILRQQIDAGGPIYITHPDATRYFMTIPEACQLVLQAGSEAFDQSVLILDMGEPVKIIDVARRMVEMSGKPIEIIISGLRPGEKVHEDLVGLGEELLPSSHGSISRAICPALSPRDLTKFRSSFRRLDDRV